MLEGFEVIWSVAEGDGFQALLLLLVMSFGGFYLLLKKLSESGLGVLFLGCLAGLILKFLVDKLWRALRD